LLRKNYTRETANALRELFQWCLQDGQLYAPDLGYIQVPASVAEKALAALNKIEAGS
jgi:ABC-type phosphate transport system substrate-binding protein